MSLNEPFHKQNSFKFTRQKTKQSKISAQELWETEEGAWDYLLSKSDKDKVFFEHLEIADDGGMSEIGTKDDLWYNTRYISSVLLFVFVVYNIYFVIKQDIVVLQMKGEDISKKGFLLSETLTNLILSDLKVSVGGLSAKAVSIVELVMLGYIICRTITNVFKLYFATGYRKWRACSWLMWVQLPELSIFSSIKLLSFITPQQFSYDLNYLLWYDNKCLCVKLIAFLVSRILIIIIGMDCFLVKVRAADTYLEAQHCTVNNVMGCLILLTQILGVVNINKTIKWRLYRFVFGGEDGIMTEHEKVRQEVWEAMVAQRIYHKYPLGQATALMLTWCDDDFQMLLLNEHHHELA